MFNSFFARVAFFQFVGFSVYIISILIWVYAFSIPDIEKMFDNQQEAIIKGLADISDNLSESEHDFSVLFNNVEKILIDTNNVTPGVTSNEPAYTPLISIHDKNNNIIYASKSHTFLDILPLNENKKIIEVDGIEWYVFTHQSEKKGYNLTISESKLNRQAWLGNPLENTINFFITILIVISVAIVISAYYALKPLRHIAKNIALRKLHDFNMLDPQQYYIEIRPIINGINQLMSKLHSVSLREKRFLADAAHELRTPVAAIQTQIYLLTQLQNMQEKDVVIQDMLNTISRVSSLSSQLIHMSRLESEEIKLKNERVNINENIYQCIDNYKNIASEKNIHITFESNFDIVIYNDRQVFFTVMSNLLDNAIKYTDIDGHVSFSLAVDKFGSCRIIIRDDGPGIPQQYRTKIFDRFYRIPGNSEYGCGLGLAIVKNMIHKMGGNIEIGEGLNGKGVAFIITLMSIRSDIST